MGKLLDHIISQYIEQKYEGLESQGAVDLKDESFSVKKAAEENFHQKIMDEIRSELTKEQWDEMRQEAKKSIEKENIEKRIQNIRELIIQGLFIAFFVGLEVNQLTNLLNLWIQGTCTGTIIASILFAFVIIGLVIFWFSSQVYKLIKGDL